MSASTDRQLRPIYEALDTGSNKSAILACNKLLKKQPKNDLVKALKALALVRSQKVEESLVLCDEVLASKPTDDTTLSAMMHVLRGLGRHTDMVTMYEDAYKVQPNNEELGSQTFFAHVRIGNWKAAQQIATKMHKQFGDDHYVYWSVMSAVLQANDPTTPPPIRDVLYKLAHRLISSSGTPSFVSADRFYLHLLVLRELGMYDEACELLESSPGKSICMISLACDEMRREIWKLKGLAKEEGNHASQRISEEKNRNWLEFLAVVDAIFADVSQEALQSEEAMTSVRENIEKTAELFNNVADEDMRKDRSGLLALLELEKRSRTYGLSLASSTLNDLLEKYFSRFGDKTCCFEDLRPYIALDGDDLARWTAFLESQSSSFTTIPELNRYINTQKLLRYNFGKTQVTAEAETDFALKSLQAYLKALEFGKGLPDTELQPADDLAILAGQAYISVWSLTREEADLYKAASVLEYACSRSKQSFQVRLLLIRIYRLLGAPSLALEHYRMMYVKQVQNDTLSHFVLSRASLFSLSSMGDLTYSSECLESSQIYVANSQETAEYIVRAFGGEKYTQVPEFVIFEDRLDNSLQRDLTKMEHVRMRMVHEQINSDLVDMELIELKFIFDRSHHDNRDFDILLNYQPRSGPSINEQTTLFQKETGLGWLWVLLKIYIRAFQLASDLDDTVEDKLLIGDRPKPSLDPENRLPLKERLAKRKQEELDELTPDESGFLEYATALADWLAPYHDYTRPPPSAVLAEAAEQTKLKTGHSLKGLELPTNGTATNGNAKKDEDVPPIRDAPDVVAAFFDKMSARFNEVLNNGALPYEVLHVVTLTQEAFILFAMDTARFKPASVVKVNKLGPLVQGFKEIRTKAVDLLKTMSSTLVTLSEKEATIEGRKTFVEACKPVWESPALDHDFVLNVAKKVTDARKQILDGVGKGVLRVCKNHA